MRAKLLQYGRSNSFVEVDDKLVASLLQPDDFIPTTLTVLLPQDDQEHAILLLSDSESKWLNIKTIERKYIEWIN